MRRRFLPIDAYICLALSVLVSLGTGYIAGRVAEKVYAQEVEKHQPVAGEIGGPADGRTKPFFVHRAWRIC